MTLITAEQIRQYCYCPRKIYWRDVAKVQRPQTYLMEHGQKYHEKKVSRNYLHRGATTHREFFMSSEELGLKGLADAILEYEDRIVVIEYKHNIPEPIPKGYVLQLAAVCLLAERHFGKQAQRGEIRTHSGRKKVVELDEDVRTEVLDVQTSVDKLLENGDFPQSCGNLRKCTPCEYNNICDADL